MQLMDRCVYTLESVVIILKLRDIITKGFINFWYTQTMQYIFMQLKFINGVYNFRNKT